MSVDVDDMTDEDFLRAMEDLPLNDKTEIGELLKAMNENHMITWEEAERIMADANDEPIKCSLVEQTRPTEPDNETNVDKCIQQLQSNDPDLTQINLNNMKRTPVPQLRRLIEAMAYNEHLEKLSLANMGLYDHDVAILIEAIRLNQHLKHINLETNYLSGEFFSGLFEAALENESIEEIKAVNQGVSFSTEAEKNIIKAIQKNHGLCKVSLTLRLPEGRHKIEQTTLRNGEIRRILRRKQREEEEAKRKAEQGTMPSKGTEPKIGVQAMKLTPKPSGTAPMILAETSKPKPKPVDKFNKFMERARPEMEFDTEPVYATPKTDPTVIKKTESVRKPEPKPEVKPEPKKLDPFKPQGQEKKGEIKMVVAKKKQAVSQAQETRAALPRPEVTPETKGTAPMILAEEPEPSKSDQHVCDILEVHPSERKALQLPEQEQDQTIQGLKAEKKPKKKHTTDILELPEVHRKKELKLTEVDQEAKVQTKVEKPIDEAPSGSQRDPEKTLKGWELKRLEREKERLARLEEERQKEKEKEQAMEQELERRRREREKRREQEDERTRMIEAEREKRKQMEEERERKKELEKEKEKEEKEKKRQEAEMREKQRAEEAERRKEEKKREKLEEEKRLKEELEEKRRKREADLEKLRKTIPKVNSKKDRSISPRKSPEKLVENGHAPVAEPKETNLKPERKGTSSAPVRPSGFSPQPRASLVKNRIQDKHEMFESKANRNSAGPLSRGGPVVPRLVGGLTQKFESKDAKPAVKSEPSWRKPKPEKSKSSPADGKPVAPATKAPVNTESAAKTPELPQELPLSPEPIKKATAEKLEPTPTTPKAEKKLKKKTPEPVVRIQTDSPVSVASTTEASSSSAPKTKAGVEKKENGKLVAGPKKAKVDEAKKDASPVRPSWRREKKADAPKPEVSNVEAAQPEVPKAAEPSSKTEEVAQEVDAKLEIQKVEDSGVEPKPEVSEVAPVVEQQEDHKVEAPSENGDLKVEDPKEAREASPIVPKKMYTVEQASISSSVREPQNGVPWRSRGALSPTKPKKSPSPVGRPTKSSRLRAERF